MIKVAITGSTGFIGKRLTTFLIEKGVTVIALRKEHFSVEKKHELSILLNGCDVVVNLAGAPVICRWTKANKKRILDSRVKTTRKLVDIINELSDKPKTLISISAVGIYSAEEVWNENDGTYENDFLSHVCRRWEGEAKKVSNEVRLIIPRLGVVLDKSEGAFPKMMFPFKYYLGGRIASGHQGFSWIHIQDLLNIFWYIINKKEVKGVIHATAPQICDNLLFTYTLARMLSKPVIFYTPRFLLHLLYGEGATVLTKGQKVFPSKLVNTDFHFEFSDLKSAIKELCTL